MIVGGLADSPSVPVADIAIKLATSGLDILRKQISRILTPDWQDSNGHQASCIDQARHAGMLRTSIAAAQPRHNCYLPHCSTVSPIRRTQAAIDQLIFLSSS
jgi:hypothetical protein